MSDNNSSWTTQKCMEGNSALEIPIPSMNTMTDGPTQIPVNNISYSGFDNMIPNMQGERIDIVDVKFPLCAEIGKQMGKECMSRARDQSSNNYELTNGTFSRVHRYFDGSTNTRALIENKIKCESVCVLQGHTFARFSILKYTDMTSYITDYIDMSCFEKDKKAVKKFITTYCDVVDEKCYKDNAQSALLRILREKVNQCPIVINKTGWVKYTYGYKYIKSISLSYDVSGCNVDKYEIPKTMTKDTGKAIRGIEKFISDNILHNEIIGYLILFSIKALLNTRVAGGTIRQDTIVLYGNPEDTITIAKSILRFVKRQSTDDNLSLYDYDSCDMERYLRVTYDDVVVIDGNHYEYFNKKQRDVLDRLASGRRIGGCNLMAPVVILMNKVSKDMDINVPLVDCCGVNGAEFIAEEVVTLKNHIIEYTEGSNNALQEIIDNSDNVYLNIATWMTKVFEISGSDFSKTLIKGALYAMKLKTPCLKLPTQVFKCRIGYLMRSRFIEMVDIKNCYENDIKSKVIIKDNKLCFSSYMINRCLTLCNLEESGIKLLIEKDFYLSKLISVYDGSDYHTDVWIPNIGKKISVLAIKRDFFNIDTDNCI